MVFCNTPFSLANAQLFSFTSDSFIVMLRKKCVFVQENRSVSKCLLSSISNLSDAVVLFRTQVSVGINFID